MLNMATYAAVVHDKSNVYDGKRIGGMMKTDAEWAEDVKRLLRAEMTRRGVTYDGLSERLATIGIEDTAVNLRNKVARGRFSAVFLIQSLAAMGVPELHLESIETQQISS
jgi:hypothetical protein